MKRILVVKPELRAIHVDERYTEEIFEVLYFKRNFDLAKDPPESMFRRVNLVSAIIKVVQSRADLFEAPEPLWVRFLWRNMLLCATWHCAGMIRGRLRPIVTYALENNDLVSLVYGRSAYRPKGPVALISVLIGVFTYASFGRIAYASQGSAETYGKLPLVNCVRRRVFEAIPAKVDRRPVWCRTSEIPPTAIFIGALEERKGLVPLMSSWEIVERRMPEARLILIGDGPLRPRVESWASKSSCRQFLGKLSRGDGLQILEQCDVLLSPSIRSGRWREQVCLPIGEALARGKTIVSSNETGISSWLSAHGHTVLDQDGLVTELPDAIVNALLNPIKAQNVFESLPTTDGYRSAMHWLRYDTQ